ncbi:lipid-A-disaccharide synthase [Candidatus Dependentiae bacterium]|nr:lipid-A-disaccharide synthase [Candidatus Dependentiae bacterium]
MMKNKIFIVSGELSGDQSGAWYLNKIRNENIEFDAVGGSFLRAAGAKIYEDIEKLNITGVVEVLGKLKFIFTFLKQLSNHIIKNNFNKVILVDFPGFNLMLAKRLKKLDPKIQITYLSPPQLWVWGSWRLKKIKKYCDKLVVLYPFEVDWYKKQGFDNVEFIGNPLCSKLNKYLLNDNLEVKNQIAILPGSRKQEIKKLLPFFARLIKKVKLLYPNMKIVLPVADSIDSNFLEKQLRKHNLYNHGQDVFLVAGEDEKIKALKESILAITKPGTITLELALLEIPSVIFYKTSWITYLLAKMVVNVEYMGLPNLFLNKPIYKEFIQGDCKVDLIFEHVKTIYESFFKQNNFYKNIKKDLNQIKNNLCS